ncbi:MAG: hypothetical protein K2X25_16130 [Caulobacteraceae bacterium]|nr:hypothetical protein [Caulobacteraceae bacterium]
MRSILFAAALMAATPALAQETAPTPPAASDAASDTADAEAAFEARAEAFQGRIRQMGEEMGAAIAAAGTDRARRDADLDAVQSRYQPEMDAFAADLEAFVLPQIAAMPADQQSGARAGVEAGMTQLRGLPATVRAQAEQAADNPQ